MSRTPNPNEFLVFPIVDLDLMVFYRGSDISRPLYVPYRKFIEFITANITPASALLLQTNGTNNGSQTLLNLIEGSGITITDNGSGGITISASGGGSITADNGLTLTGSNVQLGSPTAGGAPLLHDTYIDTLTDKTLFLEGQKTNLLEYILDVSNTANDGNAILASVLGLGTALRATSVSASAVSANSTNAPAIAASTGGSNEAGLFTNSDAGTNNIVQGIRLRHSSSGVPTAGFGIAAEFSGKTTLNSDLRLGRLSFVWEDAITASRTSKFQIHTVDSGVEEVKVEVLGDGQTKLNKYGSGTFTGTPTYYAAWDANGNFIEEPIPSGGGGSILHGTAAGTDTYTVTITGATAYADGDAYLIRFTNGNTTGCTLNINSQGAIPLYRNNDGPLLGGDVIAGGEMICVYNSTLNIFQCIGVSPNSLIAYVTNDDSVTITKGQPVYAFSGTGDRMTVKLANNVGDATSAQTVGLVLSTSIAANQKGLIMMQGLLDGLSNVKPVDGWTDGSPVYLGTTAGSITPTKQYAPNHLVYLGFVTTASPGAAGRIYVRVQNGFELDELHNVQAQTPALKDTLWYDDTVSPPQWKTASITTILGYTPGSVTSVSATVPSPTSPALSVNVTNPTTTPAIAITANGTTSQYIRGDGSLATLPGGGGVPDIAIYPYMVATYLGDINPLDIHVSATEDRLYLPANSSGTIKFYEASTNVLLGSVALTNVGSCFYIESTGELWATNLSNGTINRYDASTPGASLGTITGSGTRGVDHIEYSATKVFISNFTSNSVTVVNPSTNTVDATISSASLGGTGMAGMVYVDNPLSDHDGLIAVILRTTNEVALIDPATNTVVAVGVNPSSQLNSPVYIAYDIATDQYFITNASGKNISVLAPASASTFTHVKNIDGIVNPFGIVSDETTGLVYVCFGSNNTSTSNGVVSVSVIDPSTNSIARTIMTLGYNSTTTTVYNIDIDSTNGYIYVNGFSGSIGGNIATKLKIR
jgi:YVTN family beta-propeller protein